MKRTVLASVLAVSAVTAFGQGQILFSNYINPPYAQVFWANAPINGAKANHAVTAADGLTLQVYWGLGVQSSYAALTPGQTFAIDNTITTGYDPGAGHGPGGYFINVVQVFPTWTAGTQVTLGYAITTPGFEGQSALWQELAAVGPTSQAPSAAMDCQGLSVSVIPEPTTLALAGLGLASLLIFRRK